MTHEFVEKYIFCINYILVANLLHIVFMGLSKVVVYFFTILFWKILLSRKTTTSPKFIDYSTLQHLQTFLKLSLLANGALEGAEERFQAPLR